MAETDEFGMTEEDWRWMRWEEHRYMLSMRWRALKALWLKPVVNDWQTRSRTDGVICYRDNRDEEWSPPNALLATIGLVLGRRWRDDDEQRFKARTGSPYIHGKSVCYWDSVDTYGGYEVMVCQLYPRARISIFSDGECLM